MRFKPNCKEEAHTMIFKPMTFALLAVTAPYQKVQIANNEKCATGFKPKIVVCSDCKRPLLKRCK